MFRKLLDHGEFGTDGSLIDMVCLEDLGHLRMT